MSQDGLVLGGNVRANNVGLDEDLLPVLLDGLLGEVVLLNLELLLLQQVANVLIVLLGEGVGSIDNALNLIDLWLILLPVLGLDLAGFVLEFLVESPLFDQVAIQSDGLDFLLHCGEVLDFLDDLLLDVDLFVLIERIVLLR